LNSDRVQKPGLEPTSGLEPETSSLLIRGSGFVFGFLKIGVTAVLFEFLRALTKEKARPLGAL